VRLVQVTIPAGKRDRLLRTLDDDGIDYVVTEETSGREFDSIAYIPLPTNAVEPTLDGLREAGLDDDSFTVVLDANTVVVVGREEADEIDRRVRAALTSGASIA